MVKMGDSSQFHEIRELHCRVCDSEIQEIVNIELLGCLVFGQVKRGLPIGYSQIDPMYISEHSEM